MDSAKKKKPFVFLIFFCSIFCCFLFFSLCAFGFLTKLPRGSLYAPAGKFLQLNYEIEDVGNQNYFSEKNSATEKQSSQNEERTNKNMNADNAGGKSPTASSPVEQQTETNDAQKQENKTTEGAQQPSGTRFSQYENTKILKTAETPRENQGQTTNELEKKERATEQKNESNAVEEGNKQKGSEQTNKESAPPAGMPKNQERHIEKDKQYPNYLRRQQNSNETKENVNNFLRNGKIAKGRIYQRKEEFDSFIKSKMEVIQHWDAERELFSEELRNAYRELIEALTERRDYKQNIFWHVGEKQHEDTTFDLIRLATNATSIVKTDELPEPQYIQVLNLCRMAIFLLVRSHVHLKVITKDNFHKAIEKVKRLSAELLKKYTEQESPLADLHDLHHKIIAYLEKDGGMMDAARKLDTTMSFGNLEQTHYHISTVTTAFDQKKKKYDVIESDVMNLGLTQKEVEDYQKIALHKNRENADTYVQEKLNIEWYDELDTWLKDTLVFYAPVVLAQTKVLPTLLIEKIEGLRNAYTRFTSVKKLIDFTTWTEEEKTQEAARNMTVILKTMHSGSVPFGGRESELAVSNENLLQLEMLGDKDKPIDLNSLNSKVEGKTIELTIVTKTMQLNGHLYEPLLNKEVHTSVTPVNQYRFGAVHSYASIVNLLYLVGHLGIFLRLNAVPRFLSLIPDAPAEEADNLFVLSKEELINAYKKKEQVPTKPLYLLFLHAIIAKSLFYKDPVLSFKNNGQNIEYEIVAHSKMISYFGNSRRVKRLCGLWNVFNLSSCTFPTNIPIINTYCKSGKDRTGSVEVFTSWMAINDYLNLGAGSIDLTEQEKNLSLQNLQRLIDGGHFQFLTGVQGGGLGAFGLKKGATEALSKFPFSLTHGLYLQTSRFNRILK